MASKSAIVEPRPDGLMRKATWVPRKVSPLSVIRIESRRKIAPRAVGESQPAQQGGQRVGDGVVRPEVVVVPRPRWSERVRDRAQGGREQEEETDERDQERRDPHPDRDPPILVDDGQDQAETLLPGDHRETPWTAGGAGCVSRE